MSEGVASINLPAEAPGTAPATVEAAHARRAEILADKSAGKKLMDGDVALRAEWQELNKMIADATPEGRLENAMAGTPPSGIENTSAENPLTTSQLYSAVKGMREGGLSDTVIKEIILGAPITQQQHDAFANFKKQCLGDRAWRTRYLAGDMDAKRDFFVFTAGVTAPVAEAK
jgi:hypothetical protein